MINSWQIGAVEITRIVESEVPVPYYAPSPMIAGATPEALQEMSWLRPHYATEEGHLRFAVQALVVTTPEVTLVVDTCIGNDRPRAMTGGRALRSRFLERLEAHCPRQKVDLVVCTHLHVDHVGWNTMLVDGSWTPTFPNARYLIGRQEYAHWESAEGGEQAVVMADSIAPVFDAGLVDLVEMDHQIAPGVRLRPTPGHTPGHVSVDIQSRGQRALITGDVLHHPCQVARPRWSTAFDEDREAATALRMQMLQALADSDTLVVGTHFTGPSAGYVRRDGSDLRFEGQPWSSLERPPAETSPHKPPARS